MPAVRPIAVGLPVRDGWVLLQVGPGGAFHRPVGGGIEFGETAEQAVRREFGEELGVTLDGTRLLGVVENVFEYAGAPGHEIAFVFAVASADLDAIPLDAELHVLDEGSPVRWVEVATLDRPLHPDGAESLLRGLLTAET